MDIDPAGAVEKLKQYVSETKYRIQLRDLVHSEVERVVELTSTDAYAAEGVPDPDTASLTGRVRGYEATCSTLLAMASVGGFWAEPEHHIVWKRALERLYPPESRSDFDPWLGLRRYPATLLLYALGLGAVEADRLGFLGDLLATTVKQKDSEDVSASEILPPFCMFSDNRWMNFLEGKKHRLAPLNEWMRAGLRDVLKDIVPAYERYAWTFDRFEILAALACGYRYKPGFGEYWAPPGIFGYSHGNRIRFFDVIRTSLNRNGDGSPFVASGIFGVNARECMGELEKLETFVGQLRWW